MKALTASVFLLITSIPTVYAQTYTMDSAAVAFYHEVRALARSNSSKPLIKLFQEKRQIIRHDPVLFDTTINYLLAAERADLVGDVLQYNPFLMSQHNQLALYHYYKGVAQILNDRGWPSYKQAERSLQAAARELSRSSTPDYGFYSDVCNARGYLSITARGESTSRSKEKDLVCVVRHEYIYLAIRRFQEALIYNPDNAIAQANLDSMIAKLALAGLPPPEPLYRENLIPSGLVVAFDSLNIDSLHNTSSIPVLDYSLLPRNYQLILTELSQYDEIILCLDLSGSMDDDVGWGLEASRFAVAQNLALFLAMKLRQDVFLGAISVGQDCDVTSMVLDYPIASVSRQEFALKINEVRPYGHTPLNRRLRMTKDMFSVRANRKVVFLISDGMDTCNDLGDLCATASMLAGLKIDLSVFSFINETLSDESRTAYSIYNCMVNPSEGKIYKVTADGGVQDEIDYEPVSNNILEVPAMDTSILWSNNPILFQFPIEGVVPPVREILKLKE